MDVQVEEQRHVAPIVDEVRPMDVDEPTIVPDDDATPPVLAAAERLANGNWRCGHACKSGCNHKCCKDGTKKPPKMRRGVSAQSQPPAEKKQPKQRARKRTTEVIESDDDNEDLRPQPRKKKALTGAGTKIAATFAIQPLQLTMQTTETASDSDSDMEKGLEGLRFAMSPTMPEGARRISNNVRRRKLTPECSARPPPAAYRHQDAAAHHLPTDRLPFFATDLTRSPSSLASDPAVSRGTRI